MTEYDKGGIKITPDDWRYATLRRGFNPRWSSEPDYIRLVRNPGEVVYALRAALREPQDWTRSRITVRSGGHCYEDFVCSPDVRVILDVGLMNGIYYDPDMEAVCIESGASNWDVTEKLVKKLGLLLPGGSCNTVGAGGHITGGGFGLFSRQHGLTVDYLYGVEVAVVTGRGEVRLVTATADDEGDLGDLFWAHTGGGGGNFGVVTRFWFRGLPKAPSGYIRVEAGWRWADFLPDGYDDFKRVVTRFGEFFRDHQDEDDEYAALFGILQLTPSNNEKIGLLAQMDADIPGAEDRVWEFVRSLDDEIGPFLVDRTEVTGEHPVLTASREPVHVDWEKLSQVPILSNNEAGKYKSAYLRRPLPERQIQALWNGLTNPPDGVTKAVMQIDSYGSAINRSEVETAMAQRDSIMKMQHQVYWPSDTDGTTHIAWIRDLYARMYGSAANPVVPGVPVPDDDTDGCYINYPDVDLSDPAWNRSDYTWAELYYKEHYPRLQRAKARWDPMNVFNHQQSIDLPTDD
ncbi:FAD-dependent oxidoreductase [Spiractinospora alimapuensis]|uniref:FAD-dependent oxidoreductase n=1 Tax=Spiractinospora alimapuensis TaxID=2820884 RepID=UPI001F3C8430|nr:BBE domain-containing protein [Spiractinospora alimapuensis]